MTSYLPPGPILTPLMVRVIRTLLAAKRPLSARAIAEDSAGSADVMRPKLDELIRISWVIRHENGPRRHRTDPRWVYELTDQGRQQAEVDLGPPSTGTADHRSGGRG